MTDLEQQVLNAIRDGLRDGVKQKLSCYGSPLDKLIESVIAAHATEFRTLLEASIASCMTDKQFRDNIAEAVRHTLAKTLARFGGEMEKQVNVLKSDPTTRARITLAIEEIVKQKAT